MYIMQMYMFYSYLNNEYIPDLTSCMPKDNSIYIDHESTPWEMHSSDTHFLKDHSMIHILKHIPGMCLYHLCIGQKNKFHCHMMEDFTLNFNILYMQCHHHKSDNQVDKAYNFHLQDRNHQGILDHIYPHKVGIHFGIRCNQLETLNNPYNC